MRASTSLSLLFAVGGTQIAAQNSSTSSAAPVSTISSAPVVSNNPAGAVFRATLPETAFSKTAYPDGGNIKGEVVAVSSPDGVGVIFQVTFSNLPTTGGPFPYHLHVNPVPENGNCTATLAHLDPFARGEDPVCDPKAPETCQVGDLSGKHGKIPGGADPFVVTYTDLYASTLEGIGAFFGNRSLVVHFANKTRITCANFEPAVSGLPTATSTTESSACAGTGIPTATSSGNLTAPFPTGAAVTTSKPTQSSPIVTAAGASVKVGGVGAVVFAAAVMFML
ncbi:superoxide dismutase [Podospora appendiculata]|uniref:superoxide dismutase n=1 Tax=Podospora appendiculata TaxID=314037 RepID=A0AAE0XLV7_9PEZI|nr:superoxide dismutase [Podospora appendiculata]